MEVNQMYSMPSSNPTPTPSPNQMPPRKKSKAGTITIVIGIILVILVAAAYAFTRRASVPVATDNGANIPLNNVPTQTTGTPATAVVTNSPAITGLSLVNMETFPVQYQARVSFDLVTTCATAASSVAQNGNTFTITVTSTSPIGAVCGDIVSPSQLSVSIPTSGLAAGTYHVVAGKYSKSFTISVANTPTYTSGK